MGRLRPMPRHGRGRHRGCTPPCESSRPSAASCSADSVRWHWSWRRRVTTQRRSSSPATCLAVAAAVGAAVVRRVHGDPLTCVPLSLIAVLYAGAVGFLRVPPGPHASGLLLASAVDVFRSHPPAARDWLRHNVFDGSGDRCAADGSHLGRHGDVEPAARAGGAALATLSLATLAFAPRIVDGSQGTGPTTPTSTIAADVPEPDAELCHRTLTGLVVGSSIGRSARRRIGCHRGNP